MKQILITGVTGFVGCHTALYFIENGYNVVGIGSLNRIGDSQRLEETGLLQHKSFNFIRHDLRSPLTPVLIEKIGAINIILSIASDSSVQSSIENPRDTILNNVELICTLASYGIIKNVKKFIHLSTDEVYGEVYDNTLHIEKFEYHPSNPYSASKACQENILFSFWRTYNLPIILVNCMNMYGRYQNPEKMIPKSIKYLNEGRRYQIYTHNGISGSRVYLHVSNLVTALHHIVLNIEPIHYSGADYLETPVKIHVAGEDRPISNLECYLKIAELMGIEPYYIEVDDAGIRPGYDRVYGLNDSLLRSTGWKPLTTLEEGLRDTILWSIGAPHWSAI